MKLRIVLLSAAFILSNALLAQGIKSLTKGQKIVQLQNNTMNMKMEVMGQEMEQKMSMNTTGELSIAELKEDGVKIEMKQTKMKMHTSVMGQEIDLDTDNPDDEKSKQLASSLNKIITVLTDKNSLITDMQLDEQTKALMNSNLVAGMAVGQPLSFLLMLPEKLALNSAWKISYGTDSIIKAVYNYTVTSIDNGLVNLAFTGSMNMSTTTQTNGMSVVMKMNGPINGTATVNTKTFFVVKRTTTMDMKGNTEVAGQTIPFGMKATTEEKYNY